MLWAIAIIAAAACAAVMLFGSALVTLCGAVSAAPSAMERAAACRALRQRRARTALRSAYPAANARRARRSA